MSVNELGPFLKATPQHYVRRLFGYKRAALMYSNMAKTNSFNKPSEGSLGEGFGEFVLPGEFGDGGGE